MQNPIHDRRILCLGNTEESTDIPFSQEYESHWDHGIVVGDSKIWTNSEEIKNRLIDESNRRDWYKERKIQSTEKEYSSLRKES